MIGSLSFYLFNPFIRSKSLVGLRTHPNNAEPHVYMNQVKSERKWKSEVMQAFKRWKRDNPREYRIFMNWNNRERKKYFESKKVEQGFSGRVDRIVNG